MSRREEPSNPSVEPLTAAVESYAAGNALGCAQSVIPALPRVEQLNLLLLLFSSLADLGMSDLLERIAPPIMEIVETAPNVDPELQASIAVALGVQPPRRDVGYYEGSEMPRLAFWASRRLAHAGDRDAAHRLLEFSRTHSIHPSVEGYLSDALSKHDPVARLGPSAVDRARLALQLVLKLRRADLVEGVAANLTASGEPAAIFEGAIAQALLLADDGDSEAVLEKLIAHRDLIPYALPDALVQTIWLLLMRTPDGPEPVPSLVDDLFRALAAACSRAVAARWAAVLLLQVHELGDDGPRWRRVLDFVIASDALPEAEHDSLHIITQAILEHGDPGDFVHLDAAYVAHDANKEARAELAISGALRIAGEGNGDTAHKVLQACVKRLRGRLDDESAAQDHLLVTLTRLAFHQGNLESAFAPLYELRYRTERVGGLDAAVVVEVLTCLGEIFKVMGCLGVEERYRSEPQRRPELQYPEVDEPARSDDSLPQAAYPRGDSGSTPSPLDPLLSHLQQLPQSRSSGASVVAGIEQVLAYLESSPLRDGPLGSAVHENLAVELVRLGQYDHALDHWITAMQLTVRHISALAAVCPVEDLREVCLAWAHRGDMALSIAKQEGSERRQAALEAVLRLRSLWADLRVLRRDASADGGSPRRRSIASTRRRIARLLLDGPTRDTTEIQTYFRALLDARRDRDLDEIASIHENSPSTCMAARLRAAFDASIRALGDDEAFVGYLRVGEHDLAQSAEHLAGPSHERYLAVVLRNGTFDSVGLGIAQRVDVIAEAFAARLRADALSAHPDGSNLAFAEAATVTLVDPLLDIVQGAAAVHVMGEGALAELPWTMLWSLRAFEPNALRIVHSFTRIGRSRAQSVRLTPEALVVARPDYGSPDPDLDHDGVRHFRDLPTAEIEATIVAQQCGCLPVIGRAADADAVLHAVPSGVLHIASHGFALRSRLDTEVAEGFAEALVDWGGEMFVPREDFMLGPLDANRASDPMLHSGIAMAGVNEWLAASGRCAVDTGLITAEDLSWCQLGDVDCVVLSACSSGVGKGNRALGSRGMRFAASAAGADWVIASLWPVPDVATALLMEWLYEAFAAGLVPPSALVQAQERLRDADLTAIAASATVRALTKAPACASARRYVRAITQQGNSAPFAHPYYWCGFVCSG